LGVTVQEAEDTQTLTLGSSNIILFAKKRREDVLFKKKKRNAIRFSFVFFSEHNYVATESLCTWQQNLKEQSYY